jgi:hypothetical protein
MSIWLTALCVLLALGFYALFRWTFLAMWPVSPEWATGAAAVAAIGILMVGTERR